MNWTRQDTINGAVAVLFGGVDDMIADVFFPTPLFLPTTAWRANQPKPVFADVEEDEEGEGGQ